MLSTHSAPTSPRAALQNGPRGHARNGLRAQKQTRLGVDIKLMGQDEQMEAVERIEVQWQQALLRSSQRAHKNERGW